MNAIIAISAASVSAMSPVLGRAIRLMAEPVRRYAAAGDEAPLAIAGGYQPSAQEIAEAQRVFPFAVEAMRPVTRQQLAAWLKRLNAAVRNPQDQASLEVRLGAFGTALDGYPATAFGDDTLREAMAEFAFFPSAADLKTLIDRHAEPMRCTFDAIERIARATEAKPKLKPQPQPTRTQAKIDEVATKMRMLKIERARRAAERPEAKREIPPAYLTRDQLGIAREQAGIRTGPIVEREAAMRRERSVTNG